MKKLKTGMWLAVIVCCLATVQPVRAENTNEADELSVAGWTVQTVTLTPGWNAFYLYVNPCDLMVNPETLFKGVTINGVNYAGWPVENVYLLLSDAASDVQYATDAAREVEGSNPYLAWSRNGPAILNFREMLPNRVYLCYSTADASVTRQILGTAVSQTVTWHKASGTDKVAAWNFVGVSLYPGQRVSASKLLATADTGWTTVCKIGGMDPAKPTFVAQLPGETMKFRDGEVMVVDAAQASTWVPSAEVSPRTGLDFGEELDEAILTVKNPGTARMTLNIRYDASFTMRLSVYDAVVERWKDLSSAEQLLLGINLVLDPGASEEVRFRIDRSAGYLKYGRGTLLLQAGSGALTYAPVSASFTDRVPSAPWPCGLWIGELSLDAVSFVQGNSKITHDVPAGSVMKIRAIVHVDTNNTVRLLHHVLSQTTDVVTSGETNSVTTFYAGQARPRNAAKGAVTRMESIAMDIDHPIVVNSAASASFGTTNVPLAFAWTMAANGRGNPFRHPYHPEHDGLRWDFKTPAPSGDVLKNYQQSVKPETFSIGHAVTLAFAAPDVTYPQPSTLTGTCTWTMLGVRRAVNGENIRASGTFSLHRVSRVGALVVE